MFESALFVLFFSIFNKCISCDVLCKAQLKYDQSLLFSSLHCSARDQYRKFSKNIL